MADKLMVLKTLKSRKDAISLDALLSILKKDHEVTELASIIKILDQLEKDGMIVYTKKGNITLPENQGLISAKIVSQSKHFAFAETVEKKESVYIDKNDIKMAVSGDLVMLKDVNDSLKGLYGKVEKIITKGSRTITGTVSKQRGIYILIPDSLIRYDVPIKHGFTSGVKSGDKVLGKLSLDMKTKLLNAKIIKKYGSASSAKVCADAIIDANGLPSSFSECAIDEAKKLASSRISTSEINRRLDLRKEAIFTIDGEDSKDLDDAISVKRFNDYWELGVHIADVSHYVKEKHYIDNEAEERGTSVYFADRVIPMLPKEISNGICSLNAHEDKLTLSVIIKIDLTGKILSFDIKKSIINSKVRGVYSEINKILDNTAKKDILDKYSVVRDSILQAKELSQKLDEVSAKRGSIEIESNESKFKLNKHGVCIDIFPRVQGESEKIIESFMIVANECVALYAKTLNIPFLFRVHEYPNDEKIKVLSELAHILGLKLTIPKNGIKSSNLNDLLNSVKGKTSSTVISHQVLRTMQKARYDSKPIGHFGLALEDYCHFTSPIRRYPDLIIHRILTDVINGIDVKKINDKYADFTPKEAKHSSMCEARAVKAEREAEKYYMAEYMSSHIGETHVGIISGATGKGVFVELENTVEGFLDLSRFGRSQFVFDGLITHKDIKTGKSISIGDPIEIIVISSDVSTGLIDFDIPNK